MRFSADPAQWEPSWRQTRASVAWSTFPNSVGLRAKNVTAYLNSSRQRHIYFILEMHKLMIPHHSILRLFYVLEITILVLHISPSFLMSKRKDKCFAQIKQACRRFRSCWAGTASFLIVMKMVRSVTWSPQLSTEGSFASSSSSVTLQQSGGRPPLPQRRQMPPPSLRPSLRPSSLVGGKPPMPPSREKSLAELSAVMKQSQDAMLLHNKTTTQHISNDDVVDGEIEQMQKKTLSSVAKASAESTRDGEGWRKHGKLYRAKLIMEDEESGGNTFVLSNKCNIERYYNVAERVSCFVQQRHFLPLDTVSCLACLVH